MHDSTLDLFTNNEATDDREHMIDTMAETYWDAMNNCVNDGREFDAISVYEEWVVDGIDPQDGGTEFIFVPDFTRETEEN
ncbi:hypothetical protein [Synechococcus phage S-M1]|uniref:Uncharacterized protein n=1 Tax=Synechococcus phage QB2 TaxID=3159453 RepID=A0AAU8EL43_9CAUD|nr:hypothetical protein [Synechococcus phage S-M1]